MNDNDDDLFGNIQDPYERLNEMEVGLVNHAHHIESITRQLKQNAGLIVQLSDGMKEMARAIDQLQKQQLYIYRLLKEGNESNEQN